MKKKKKHCKCKECDIIWKCFLPNCPIYDLMIWVILWNGHREREGQILKTIGNESDFLYSLPWACSSLMTVLPSKKGEREKCENNCEGRRRLFSLSLSSAKLQSSGRKKDDGVFNFILQIIPLRLSHTVPTVVQFISLTHIYVCFLSLSLSLSISISVCVSVVWALNKTL